MKAEEHGISAATVRLDDSPDGACALYLLPSCDAPEEGASFAGGVVDEVRAARPSRRDGGSLLTSAPQRVVRVEVMGRISPRSMRGWFRGLTRCESMDLSGLDTSGCSDMSYVFSGCWALAALDLSAFDTSRARTMHGMFSTCSSLSRLDTSGWDTSSVRDASWMFSCCSSLDALDIADWDLSRVRSTLYMFHDCSSLRELRLPHRPLRNVRRMGSMFEGCESLEQLDASSVATALAEDMMCMFAGCSSLRTLDISGMSFSPVVPTPRPPFVTLRSYDGMFDSCWSLSTVQTAPRVHASAFGTPGHRLFALCASLVGGEGTRCDGLENTDWRFARVDGLGGKPGYFTAKSPGVEGGTHGPE